MVDDDNNYTRAIRRRRRRRKKRSNQQQQQQQQQRLIVVGTTTVGSSSNKNNNINEIGGDDHGSRYCRYRYRYPRYYLSSSFVVVVITMINNIIMIVILCIAILGISSSNSSNILAVGVEGSWTTITPPSTRTTTSTTTTAFIPNNNNNNNNNNRGRRYQAQSILFFQQQQSTITSLFSIIIPKTKKKKQLLTILLSSSKSNDKFETTTTTTTTTTQQQNNNNYYYDQKQQRLSLSSFQNNRNDNIKNNNDNNKKKTTRVNGGSSNNNNNTNKQQRNKKQLRWIVQTVQRQLLYEQEKILLKQQQQQLLLQNKEQDNDNYNSILLLEYQSSNITILIEALGMLCTATNQSTVTTAGRKLEILLLQNEFLLNNNIISSIILERIVQATAITGLLYPITLKLVQYMITVQQHIPSYICQDTIFTSLRKVQRISTMESLLQQIGQLTLSRKMLSSSSISSTISSSNSIIIDSSSSNNNDDGEDWDNNNDNNNNELFRTTTTRGIGVSVVSLNIFLAALCDCAINNNNNNKNNNVTAAAATTTSYLTKAWEWIQGNEKQFCYNNITSSNNTNIYYISRAEEVLGIIPDPISYATVLQAAASIGNTTLVDMIWYEHTKRNITPNIVSYNARIKLCYTKYYQRQRNNNNNLYNLSDCDNEIIQLWEEIEKDTNVTPDRYTIDLILLPLIRAGRIGDIEKIIDRFISRNSETVVSDAFAAFLVTIVDADELGTARALFEMYVVPTLLPVMTGTAGLIRIVKPNIRHFNILLEAYRRRQGQQRCVVTSGTPTYATTTTTTTNTQVRSFIINRLQNNNVNNSNNISSSDIINNNKSDNTGITTDDDIEANEEAWGLFRLIDTSLSVQPDTYTITTMMGLCRNTSELTSLIHTTLTQYRIDLNSVVLRAALTAYGDLDDPASAVWIFCYFPSKSTRTWNVLLGSLAKSAAAAANTVEQDLDPNNSVAAKLLGNDRLSMKPSQKKIYSLLDGTTVIDASRTILHLMSKSIVIDGLDAPRPNAQSYCIVASALQYSSTVNSTIALEMFRNATTRGIVADGRFVNAIFRCYGDDIDQAIYDWKNEIRTRCLLLISDGNRNGGGGSGFGAFNDNLLACYNGLLHVCGRSHRPDIALRLVYAMSNKEGIETTEQSFNSYKSGKRLRKVGSTSSSAAARIVQRLKLVNAYESLLEVECSKYNGENDKRRQGEPRVRIIV